jgi:iduronate 2-sulfatase
MTGSGHPLPFFMTPIKRLVCLGGLLCCLAAGLSAASAARKPNVLLIISDDLNCRLGCYGAAEAKTPNIDRLAARGIRFDRAYCNYPVCNVSRTSFLSGRYPEVTGVLNNGTNPRTRLGPNFQFLPEYFRAQGYFTAGCGKVAHGSFNQVLSWDYYSEPQRGIDGEGDDPARPQKTKQAGKKAGKKGKATTGAGGAGTASPFPWQATENADADEPDGQVARRLIKYLGEKREQPFFVAAGFHKPHVPHTAPQKYFGLHEPARMPTPPEPAGHEKKIPAIAHAPRSEFGLTVEHRRAIIQHYYAATSFMDAQVGLLLDELDRQQLWDSTIVVFMSDHGWHLGEHGGFYAKMSLMDESARAPLIVAAPGVKPGSATSAVAEYVDLFPTLADLTGLAAPAGLQGTTLVPVLRNSSPRARDDAYTIVVRGNDRIGRALHTPKYTYLEWPDGSQQLYDAVSDPREYDNLAAKPEHAATLATMKKLLEKRRAEIVGASAAATRSEPATN